jgi:hypothetical protein
MPTEFVESLHPVARKWIGGIDGITDISIVNEILPDGSENGFKKWKTGSHKGIQIIRNGKIARQVFCVVDDVWEIDNTFPWDSVQHYRH